VTPVETTQRIGRSTDSAPGGRGQDAVMEDLAPIVDLAERRSSDLDVVLDHPFAHAGGAD